MKKKYKWWQIVTLEELIETNSISFVARLAGIKPGTLSRQRLYFGFSAKTVRQLCDAFPLDALEILDKDNYPIDKDKQEKYRLKRLKQSKECLDSKK